ncbi:MULTISPECIES: flagellar hook-basal body complex protein FliE [unclassified Butyrivibrio]|jgi:flagellar hook-basal body complex protein FliE|uniref:flagellar hook-basal body complex protein FliE n=1 Tax=unclassified Butyrivibrio TaxID=2639466 RepID=UPI00040AA920|nr:MULTISPECIES: flagellar hook-basal body complex protein FliE [unclassified Butyrivibrio]
MADIDISQVRNVHSRAIRDAEKAYSTITNPVGDRFGNDGSFTNIFTRAVENINTTNAYLSDAENEEIKWALGETDNTHDLGIALQKAETALQYTIAVRDRLLTAYRDIMNMQI